MTTTYFDAELSAEAARVVRRGGPAKYHRTDLTLPPTVVEAAVRHARSLRIKQVEYFCLAINSYFKHCLLNPPEPIKTQCEHCGARIREPRSAWKRLRLSTRLDSQARQLVSSLSEHYFAMNWSRAFEASVRFFLGEERDPPPEGTGLVPGVKMRPGRKSKRNPSVRLPGQPSGRQVTSVEGMIRKIAKEDKS